MSVIRSQTKRESPKNSGFLYTHVNNRAESSENLHPGKEFSRTSDFSGLKLCLCSLKATFIKISKELNDICEMRVQNSGAENPNQYSQDDKGVKKKQKLYKPENSDSEAPYCQQTKTLCLSDELSLSTDCCDRQCAAKINTRQINGSLLVCNEVLHCYSTISRRWHRLYSSVGSTTCQG